MQFSANIAVGLLMFLVYPLSGAYIQAVNLQMLSFQQKMPYMAPAMAVGIQGLIFGIVIIGLASDASNNDFLTLILAFLMMMIIYRKGSDFFNRYFFKGLPPA